MSDDSTTLPGVSRQPFELGSATDVGRVREANEDAFLTFQPDGERAGQTLVAVADGMGGHQAGEVASALAIEALVEGLTRAAPEASAERVLLACVELANRTVWDAAAADAARDGMGTTLVCALIDPAGGALIANVGDSRAYVYREGRATLLTSDHTWVNQQVQSGQMSEREARTSPYRNLLTRSVGNAPQVEADLFEAVLEVREALILVSDGVTGYLDESDLSRAVNQSATAQETAERLVGEAVERGGADNATAVVVIRRR